MKQYCRYCVHLITGNGTYCEAHKKELSTTMLNELIPAKILVFAELMLMEKKFTKTICD